MYISDARTILRLPVLMPTKGLTDKQRSALGALMRLSEDFGRSPSMRELADVLAITPRGAWLRVVALEKKGYVQRRAGQGKAAEIYGVRVLKGLDGADLPPMQYGTVPGGKPQLVVDEPGTIITTTDHRHLRVVILDHDDDARHAKRGDRVFVEDVEPESDRDWVVDGGVVRELRRPKV